MKLKFFAALYIAKLAAWGIKIVARDRGTNLPGRIALKIDPDFISHIDGLRPEKTIFVTTSWAAHLSALYVTRALFPGMMTLTFPCRERILTSS